MATATVANNPSYVDVKLRVTTETQPRDPALNAPDLGDLEAEIVGLKAQNAHLQSQTEYVITLLHNLSRRALTAPNASTSMAPFTPANSLYSFAPGSIITFTPGLTVATMHGYPSGEFTNWVLLDTSVNPALSTVAEEAFPQKSMKSRGDVPLPLLIEVSSVVVGAACFGSVLTWLFASTPPINPFVSLIGCIAAPFFFSMGRIARRELS